MRFPGSEEGPAFWSSGFLLRSQDRVLHEKQEKCQKGGPLVFYVFFFLMCLELFKRMCLFFMFFVVVFLCYSGLKGSWKGSYCCSIGLSLYC